MAGVLISLSAMSTMPQFQPLGLRSRARRSSSHLKDMAKKKPSQRASTPPVTDKRAARLYRLLQLVGKKPQSRDVLAQALGHGVRGFYRDLVALRKAGIKVQLKDGRYTLVSKLQDAIASLPFPDPGLTLGEATALCKGRTPAHRKLKQLVDRVTK
jgi:biotin operon repressor